MPTYLTETFTGTTGAVISTTNWVTGSNTTGATATIDSNRGRWGTGTSGTGRVSRRVNTGASTYSDLEFTGEIELSSGNNFPQICLRCDANVDTERGYQLTINRFGTMQIVRIPSAYSGAVVATQSRTFVASTVYKFRFRAIGGLIQARVWTGTEPTTWDLQYTDSSPLAAGYAGITVGNGAAVNSYTWFDNLVLSSGSTTITLTGSTTTAGAFLKTANKSLVGTILATGAAVKRTTKDAFTASITGAGLLTNSALKRFTASVSATGALSRVKVVLKTVTASISATGAFLKIPRKVLLGTVTPSGASVKRTIKAPFVASITASGSVLKTTLRTFGAAIASTGALTRRLVRIFGGSITTVGTVIKMTRKTPTGSITPTATFVKVSGKIFVSTVTASGFLRRFVPKVFAGVIITAGETIKRTAKSPFTGSITASGFFRKSFIRIFTGSITATSNAIITFIGRFFGRPGEAIVTVEKTAEAIIRIPNN